MRVLNLKEKFTKKVNTKFGLSLDHTKIRRTYAGRGQRTSGALSWFFLDCHPDIGSQWPITELLKAKDIDFDGENFYPLNE